MTAKAILSYAVASRAMSHQQSHRAAIAQEVQVIYEEDNWHFFNGMTEKTGSVPTQPMGVQPTFFIFHDEQRLIW